MNEPGTSTVSSTEIPCEHGNGWFFDVHAVVLFVFRKKIKCFACTDCQRILDADTKERID